MSDEEFFNKYIMENPFSFKNGIIAHCRELDKEDVYEWVANDELKIRKLIQENQQLKEKLQQKEDIINKIKKCIEEKEEYYGDYMGDGNYTMYSMMGANNNRIPYIKSNLIKQILDNKGEK